MRFQIVVVLGCQDSPPTGFVPACLCGPETSQMIRMGRIVGSIALCPENTDACKRLADMTEYPETRMLAVGKVLETEAGHKLGGLYLREAAVFRRSRSVILNKKKAS